MCMFSIRTHAHFSPLFKQSKISSLFVSQKALKIFASLEKSVIVITLTSILFDMYIINITTEFVNSQINFF